MDLYRTSSIFSGMNTIEPDWPKAIGTMVLRGLGSFIYFKVALDTGFNRDVTVSPVRWRVLRLFAVIPVARSQVSWSGVAVARNHPYRNRFRQAGPGGCQ